MLTLLAMYIQIVYTSTKTKHLLNPPMTQSSKKKAISFRIDTSLLDWLKSESVSGYQTLMHEILQQYRQAQVDAAQRKAGRAQELYRQYYTQCFWHYDPELVITPENTHLVIEGLKKYGGRTGYQLAEDLCL